MWTLHGTQVAQYLCRLILLGVTSTSSRERRTPPLNPEVEDIAKGTLCNTKQQKNKAILYWTELSVQYLSSTDHNSYGQLEWLFCFLKLFYVLPACGFLPLYSSLLSIHLSLFHQVPHCWLSMGFHSQLSKLCFLCDLYYCVLQCDSIWVQYFFFFERN